MQFVHPDDAARVSEDFAQLLKNPGGTYQAEVRARHKDGSWRTIEIMARNLLDDPIVGGIITNVRDITERKTAEREHVEHAAALARAEELERSRQRIVAAQEFVRQDIALQLHGSVQNRLIIVLHRLAEMERTANAEANWPRSWQICVRSWPICWTTRSAPSATASTRPYCDGGSLRHCNPSATTLSSL